MTRRYNEGEDRIVRCLEAIAQQQIMDARHPQPITPVPCFVLGQQRIEPLLERADPRQRLNRTMLVERAFRRSDRLPDYLARQSKITRDLLDRLTRFRAAVPVHLEMLFAP